MYSFINKKTTIGLFILTIGVLLAPQITHADNIAAQQTIYSTSTPQGIDNTGNQTISELSASDWNQVQVFVSTSASTLRAVMHTFTGPNQTGVETSTSTDITPVDGDYHLYTFTFDAITPASTTASYKLFINTIGGGTESFKGSINPDSYTGGQASIEPTKDFYFRIGKNLANPNTGAITITYPTNGYTGKYFGLWTVDYNYLATTTGIYWVEVDYASSTQTLFDQFITDPNAGVYSDAHSIGSWGSGQLVIPPGFTDQVITTTLASIPTGDYYAKAAIRIQPIGTNISYIATTSPIIQISITDGTNPNVNANQNNNATTTDPYTQCNNLTFLDTLTIPICKLSVFLFIPDTGTLSQFGNLFKTISTKPPIGWLTISIGLLEGINGTGTAATTSQLFIVIPPITDPIKTGIATILYLFTLIWLFNRIRHLAI